MKFSGVDSSFIKEEWRIEILNTFIKCHLGAPEGIRGEGANEEAEEVIEETEEDDKTKFRDQLSSIGAFSRSVASHSLVLLARLLEDRITRFSTQLQRMHGQSLSQSDQHQLGSLFEDLHWLLLISGHTLTLDSDGETAVIPQEILQHSIAQAPTVSVETTLKVFLSQWHTISLELENFLRRLLLPRATVLLTLLGWKRPVTTWLV